MFDWLFGKKKTMEPSSAPILPHHIPTHVAMPPSVHPPFHSRHEQPTPIRLVHGQAPRPVEEDNPLPSFIAGAALGAMLSSNDDSSSSSFSDSTPSFSDSSSSDSGFSSDGGFGGGDSGGAGASGDY
jgi:uncharacterized membrane protein YgcG